MNWKLKHLPSVFSLTPLLTHSVNCPHNALVYHLVPSFGLILYLQALSSQHPRQELVVGDVLDLGGDDAPGLLEHRVAGPLGVELGKGRGDPVVLPHEEGVHHRQARVLVNPAHNNCNQQNKQFFRLEILFQRQR